MKIQGKVDDLPHGSLAHNLMVEIKNLSKELKEASKFTQKFLDCCGNQGITRVSIGKKSNKVPATKEWPSGWGYEGSVFQFPSGQKGKSGWVAIWDAVEEAGISGGCGNTDQHSVSNDNLIEGVFELKDKCWRKID